VIAVDELIPLARGGTAELFAARAGAAQVVVKLARDDRARSTAALASEAAALGRLDPGIAPRVLGWTRLDERDALVLEHLAMPTLRASLHELVDPLGAAIAVCAAVARVHAAGLVHADLTPDNVLFDPVERSVRLIDFGVAAEIGAALAPLATPGYAAPERLREGCRAQPTIDVYALGVLCYELVTGAAPFAGPPGAQRIGHAAHRVPRVSERAQVPAGVDPVIARAMAKSPAGRHADAGALVAALTGALDSPLIRSTDADEPPAERGARSAVLIGFRWSVGAVALRAAVAIEGAVVAYSDAGRHVAAMWSADARGAARRLATALAAAGAQDVEIVEAELQIGAGGIPRGAAIVELGRARTTAPTLLATREPPLATREPPLVGRESPLAGVAAVAAAAATGAAALVTIWGAPGLGKSRLAAAIGERLRTLGYAVLEVRAPAIAALFDRLAVRGDHADPIERAALAAAAGRGSVAGTPAEPLAAAPGALRQAAARALARALGAGDGPRAILVDDAHAADPMVLDAFELATLPPATGVLVVALARPGLAVTRPRWGRRAAHAEWFTLAPLDRDAGRSLVRALLPAVAAVPGAALDRLVERCGGVPLYVTELVGAIQRADRARGGTRSATRGALATDLVDLPTDHGIVAWAVADELGGLSPGAVAAAEALALCARELRRAELPALFEALDAHGLRLVLDAGAALAELTASGLVIEGGGALRLRHDLVRDAIVRGVDAARRIAIHRALLGVASTATERAHHAEGAGDRGLATRAWAAAAGEARARHDDLAAEAALGRALSCGDGPDIALLRQRGNARARLGRHDAAAADFAAARELARAAGDDGATIDVLLDEATALDWSLHYREAGARAEAAAALAGDDEPALRRARLALAAARTAWRAGDAASALAPCRLAIALADAVGAEGYETAIACRLMLGFILGGRGDTDAAAAILDEAEAAATRRGDLLHVAAARCNRYPVHAARGDLAGLRADLSAFAAAGKELGVAVTEYRGELYLALVGLWCGEDTEALHHARAARRIEEADPALFPRPRAALVLAELAARRSDRADAAAWCDAARGQLDDGAEPIDPLPRDPATPIEPTGERPRPAGHSGTPIDRVMLDAVTGWLAGRLDLALATRLARTAIAHGEDEAAFQILELAALEAARRGANDEASAAHRAARSLPARLPRFIAGVGAVS